MLNAAAAFDAVVVGLGGMGSAALAHLAARGKRVLGIERFERAHERGSSAGRSRIIRMAYYEDPAYVPLLRRAYELWRELERQSGMTLLDLYGVLMVGGPESGILHGARLSARMHDIALEELDRAEILHRYPTLVVGSRERGVFEPHAGAVFPEAAIEAHLRVARAHGAAIRYETRAVAYASRATGIRLALDDGSTVEAERLAICAGPWLGELSARLDLPLRVQRNVQVWFRPATAHYGRQRFPAFFVDRPEWPAPLYGFPDDGDGVKAAFHAFGETTVPQDLDRTVRSGDVACVKDALDAWMPGAAAEYAMGKACMYTLTPDEHFIIDTHPGDARIVMAGGFSGHGYKFCPVVGEIVADLVCDGATPHPIEFLRIGRFGR
ncbi:MAG: N-methyl-L-tryptophan oxidase [Candidatus Eremiobacteraeota bacterium]|nr:N-methyl-L-tryptophan oxidase [Candidatus Eremiobacteraeota bacterium]